MPEPKQKRALSQPAVLRQVVRELASAGVVSHAAASEDPLGFVLSGAASVVEAAYRFLRHEPGADVVLTGTGSAEHLRDNVGALTLPPLPEQMRQRLAQLFGDVDTVTGN